MPEVKSYKPGSFCWADLATSDPKAAQSFYQQLFGWTPKEMPTPNGPYVLETIDGKSVAGIAATKDPHANWTPYFSVQNLEDGVKKATTLGAKMLVSAMDVEDAGRMVILEDPTGAVFSLWQPKKHIGSQLNMQAGTVCWAELESKNVDVAGGFYSKLFGWTSRTQDMGGGKKYTVFMDGGDQRAGLMAPDPKAPPNVPSHWNVYFQVDNADAFAKKVSELKGKTLVPPMDIPQVGRFAMFFDPQGAMLCVLQPAPRK